MADISKFEYFYQQLLELDEENRDLTLKQLAKTDPEFYSEFISMYKNEPEASSYFDGMEAKISGILDDKIHNPGNNVGNYKLTKLLGSGGMANVYRAERIDGVFQRESALKIIKRGIDTDEIVSRFTYERSILAGLKHENITQLYDGGVTGKGLPYFVMEFIDGEDIISYSNAHQLSQKKRLKLFLQVCDALDFAHKNLIIHRDIKPGNILVEETGKVKLMDFGIAKILRNENDSYLTRYDSRILTLEYASPEQINGDYVNTTTDIYQAGILLYELLSNKKAYNNTTKKHDLDFKHNEISSEVISIIQTATRESPGERYNSVEALKNDIENYLDNRPIKARGNNFAYRTRKFISRNKTAILISFVILTMVGILTGKYIFDITEARKAAAYRSMHATSTMNFLLSTFANQLPRNADGDTLTVFDLMNRMEYQLKHDKTFFKENLSRVYNLLADINYRYRNFEKSHEYYQNALTHHVDDPFDPYFSNRHKYISYVGLGRNYFVSQQKDSSAYYYHQAIEIAEDNGLNPIEAYTGLGKLGLLGNNYERTDSIFQKGMQYAKRPDVTSQESVAFFLGVYGNFLSRFFPHENKEKIDSLFKASIRIYNKPIRYNSNMDFEKKSNLPRFYTRQEALTGPVLKAQHPTSYAETINYYGFYLYRMEQYDSAAHYFRKAWEANANYYGKNSIVALENANNLAATYLEMGNNQNALETFLDCWHKSRNDKTIQPAFSIGFYHNYAATLYLEEKYKESLQAFDSVLILREKYTPDNDFALNHAYRNIGQNLHKLNQPWKALEYMQTVIDRHQEKAGNKGFQDINARFKMIEIYGDLGMPERVDALYTKNKTQIEERFGPTSNYIHKNMIVKANALLTMNEPAEAVAFIKPTLTDSIESRDKNYLHFLYAKSHFQAGNDQVADSVIAVLKQRPELEPKVEEALTEFDDERKKGSS